MSTVNAEYFVAVDDPKRLFAFKGRARSQVTSIHSVVDLVLYWDLEKNEQWAMPATEWDRTVRSCGPEDYVTLILYSVMCPQCDWTSQPLGMFASRDGAVAAIQAVGCCQGWSHRFEAEDVDDWIREHEYRNVFKVNVPSMMEGVKP